MPSGGDQSPPPPPPPPAAAASEEEDEDGEAEDAAQPARSPAPQTQQRFEELCSRLNMDEAARAEAWDSYRSMSESYTLEVRPGRGGGLPGLAARSPAAGLRPSGPVGRRGAASREGRGPPCAPRPWTPGFGDAPRVPGAARSRCASLARSDRGDTSRPNVAPRGRVRDDQIAATWSAEQVQGSRPYGQGEGPAALAPGSPGFTPPRWAPALPHRVASVPASRLCTNASLGVGPCSRTCAREARETGFLPSWSQTHPLLVTRMSGPR